MVSDELAMLSSLPPTSLAVILSFQSAMWFVKFVQRFGWSVQWLTVFSLCKNNTSPICNSVSAAGEEVVQSHQPFVRSKVCFKSVLIEVLIWRESSKTSMLDFVMCEFVMMSDV